MEIVIPKTFVTLGRSSDFHRPHLFLAGPIRGGGDWQTRMAVLIEQHEWFRDSLVFCPCRWDATHQFADRFRSGIQAKFERQLEWERYYLEWAGVTATRGCIIFWLPCESNERPHEGPEPYAMDTRGELGEWRVRMRFLSARVVVGAEPGFFGLSQIQRNFSAVLGRDFPIYQTMEETLDAAMEETIPF